MTTNNLAALAVLIVMATTAATGAASASAPHRSGADVPTQPATATKVALAGSPQWLIYTQTSAASVQARSAAGTTVTVTPTRAADLGWSIAANVLTAYRPQPLADPMERTIDWWNLKTKTHGTVRLNKDARYEAAAPGGFFFVSAHGNLDRRDSRSGHLTRFSKSLVTNLTSGIAGPLGLLVIKSKSIKYVAYAHPNKVISLRVPSSGGEPAQCESLGSVDRTDAVCFRASDDDDSNTPLIDIIAPLNGGKSTSTTTCPGIPSVSGRTMIWASGAAPSSTSQKCGSPTIDSIAEGATTVETSTTAVLVQPNPANVTTLPSSLTAYNESIFLNPDGTTFITATSATSIGSLDS
jgi:hypothetical protein